MSVGSDEPVLRPATPADAAVLSQLNVAAWRWAYRDLVDVDYLASLDPVTRTPMWAERLASTLARTAVAERAGRIVGYVTYGPAQDADATPAVGHVFAIYVDEHAQGTGVGQVLMIHALHDLATDGRTEATLWVLETNTLARRFYERGGWRTDGTTQDEHLGGASLHEVRYRRRLP
jgi:ribosomal protein S18 acetylase RimI-like enzyme